MDLNLLGKSVSRIDLSWALIIVTACGDEVRVETEAALTASGGASIVFDPERLQNVPELLMEAVQGSISSACCTPEGELHIEFEGGMELKVSPDDEYEAWQYSGSDGSLVVCLPGGGVATWVGTDRS